MRILLILLAFSSPALAKPMRFFVAAGLGIPEILRAEVGWLVHPRVSIEALAGFPLLAPMAGLGVTGWLLGEAEDRPPRHGLIVSLRGRFRVDELRLRTRGDSLGTLGEVMAGYSFLADGGFLLRAQAGALLYAEDGLASGPQVVVTAGYAF